MHRREYPEFTGTQIMYTDVSGTVGPVIVAGCGYYKGVTIVSEADPEWKILCLNGPDSEHGTHEQYDDVFAIVIRGIKNGALGVMDFKGFEGEEGTRRQSELACPYSGVK